MISEKDLELQLLAGMPIHIDGLGCLHSLPLGTISKMGEDEYNKIISHLLIDKDNIPELSNENISNLEILIHLSRQDKNFQNIVKYGLTLLFKEPCTVSEDGIFYFGCENRIRVIDIPIFDEIQYVLRKANCIKSQKEETEYNPGNDRAKALIEKMLKNKKKKPIPKPTINLHSMISGLAWKPNNGVNIFNIFDLTIYQLYDAFSRIENIDNYTFTLTGIYAGTIDGKSININTINWAKILQK